MLGKLNLPDQKKEIYLLEPARAYYCKYITYTANGYVYKQHVLYTEVDDNYKRVMLPKAVIVYALLALFSAGSQGNKEANVDNHRLVLSQPAVFRRDTGTCLPYSAEHYRRLSLPDCDEEFLRAVSSEIIETSNCSNVFYNGSTEAFSSCGTNHNGAVCRGIEESKYEDFFRQCFRWFSTSNCSGGCQTALRQLSDRVGCCIHYHDHAKMPSVWMNCNIEQPEICADAPDIVAKRNVAPCSEKCSLRQSFYFGCKLNSEEYEQINRECGIEAAYAVDFCGFDKGEFCFTMDDPTSYFETISDECYSDSEDGNVTDGVCSTNCSNSLEEYIDTVGCCVHYFNSSVLEIGSITFRGLSSDLFAVCSIEIPDTCQSFSSVTVPDDFLECAGLTINSMVNISNNSNVNNTINSTSSGAARQSGIYSIIIGLIATYIAII